MDLKVYSQYFITLFKIWAFTSKNLKSEVLKVIEDKLENDSDFSDPKFREFYNYVESFWIGTSILVQGEQIEIYKFVDYDKLYKNIKMIKQKIFKWQTTGLKVSTDDCFTCVVIQKDIWVNLSRFWKEMWSTTRADETNFRKLMKLNRVYKSRKLIKDLMNFSRFKSLSYSNTRLRNLKL